jgi:hypothetical protein
VAIEDDFHMPRLRRRRPLQDPLLIAILLLFLLVFVLARLGLLRHAR